VGARVTVAETGRAHGRLELDPRHSLSCGGGLARSPATTGIVQPVTQSPVATEHVLGVALALARAG